MRSRAGVVVVVAALLFGVRASATPESWLRFDRSTEGAEDGGRFGAQIACSRSIPERAPNSLIAVGAPAALGGQGRVYLYNPVQIGSSIQILAPGVSDAARDFGASIEFIQDINGDGIDELLIGAPGAGETTVGGAYGFASVTTGNAVQYVPCGTIQGPAGFGGRIRGAKVPSLGNALKVEIGNTRSSEVDSFLVSAPGTDVCQFVATGASSPDQVSLDVESAPGDPVQCTAPGEASGDPGFSGSNLYQLGDSFTALFGAAREISIIRQTESSTGGALAAIGINEDGCLGQRAINNCQLDPTQEQGAALAGGPECQISLNGRVQSMLLSGSPGWSRGRGRIDIAFDEGILASPMPCLGVAPVVTYTAVPTATALPSALVTAAPQVETPIVVVPGSSSLPAPRILQRGADVEVQMPVVSPQLTEQQRAVLVRQLQRKRGVSRNRAAQLLSDPNNLIVTYIVRYTEISAARRFAFIQSAYAQDGGRRASKARQIRSRQNSVTLRSLRPGAMYRFSYAVEISLKKPRMVLGTTQSSAEVTFAVR